MTPDQAERIARLEASMADVRSEQARQGSDIAGFRRELGSLRDLVQTLVPIGKDTAVLREQVGQLDEQVGRVETKFDKRWERLEQSQTEAARDSKTFRRTLVGIGIAAVLSPVGTLVISVLAAKPSGVK